MKFNIYLLAVALLISPAVFADEESESLSMFEKIAKNNLGRDVAFTFKPRLLGMTGLRLENFRIAENEAYLKKHPYLSPWAMSAASVDVRYNPFAIFIGRITLKEIVIDYPEVQIAINSRLEHNFEDIVAKQKKNRFSNWIRAHHIDIRNMNFNIYSELLFAQPIVYEVSDIDVNINNVIKGKVADIDIAAKTPGAARQNVSITGDIGPIVSIAKVEESPMNLQFRVLDAPLEFELAKIPEDIFNDRRYRRTLALPESGFANITYDLNGDIWKSLKIRGVTRLEDIVMASIDKSLKGKAFDIVLNSESEVSLNTQTSTIKGISLSLNDSVIELSGTIKQIIDNPQVELQLTSNSINMIEMDAIYPFISDIYQIGIAQGVSTIKLETSGNLKQGLHLNGGFETRNLQLKSLNSNMKGSTLNTAIKLNEAISYYSRDNKVEFPNIEIDVANSKINIEGEITDVTSLDRVINANISSKTMDVSAMHRFFPFIDKYLPDELRYSGALTFDASAKGNLYAGEINGKADLSKVTFRIKNFARKTGISDFDIDYNFSFDDTEAIKLSSSFLLKNGELDNSVIFINALKHLLGNTYQANSYLSQINPEAIAFTKASGNLSLLDSKTLKLEMSVKGINHAKQKDVDLNLTGTIDIDSYELNLDGELQIPENDFNEILALNPSASSYLTQDKTFMALPLKITGNISQPEFSTRR